MYLLIFNWDEFLHGGKVNGSHWKRKSEKQTLELNGKHRKNWDLGGSIDRIGFCGRNRSSIGWIFGRVFEDLGLRFQVFQNEKPGEGGWKENQNESQRAHLSFLQRERERLRLGFWIRWRKGMRVGGGGNLNCQHGFWFWWECMHYRLLQWLTILICTCDENHSWND